MDPSRNAGGQLGEYGYAGDRGGGRSTADLLKDIVGNLQEIVRSEVRLAKAEVREEASSAAQAGKLLGAGAVLGFYALGFILLSLVYLVSNFVSPWIAALIVGLVVGGAAAVLLIKGRDRLKLVRATPVKTIENVKENVAWMKDQTKS